MWWHGWTPRLTVLWCVMVGRGSCTSRIPAPHDILFPDDAIDPEVTNTLTKFLDHRLAHQGYPPQAFADLALSGPIQLTLIIFDVGFVFFVGRKVAPSNPFPCRREVLHQDGDTEVLGGQM